MQRRRVRWAAWLVPGTAALALGLLAPPPAGAQAPVPVGAQFQINSYTTNIQERSSVAADADGDFVVVWQSKGSSGTDTSYSSIQGQRYSVAAAVPPVPAMSSATRFALAAALLLLGAAYTLRRRS